MEKVTGAVFTPPAGYQITQCEMCEQDMHIGPKQMVFRAENPKAQVVCLECVAKYYEEMPIQGLDEDE